jgi:hypothetical protein
MACFASGRRQVPSTILGWPASPSLPEAEPLILGATLILLGALNLRFCGHDLLYLVVGDVGALKTYAVPERRTEANEVAFACQTLSAGDIENDL